MIAPLLTLAVLFLHPQGAASRSVSDPAPAFGVERALWVTRWDWEGEEGLRQTIRQAAEAGFDTLLFQVRGAASTFYPSRLEPFAEELGDAPAWDPLAVALEEAHAHGLALHAWMNVVPAWWGTGTPRDPSHVLHAHPEWLWYDETGARQAPSERFYLSLNPCLPEVRAHLVAVARELVEGHALDGLHLDYLRFPNEPPAVPSGEQARWPRDPRTLALYREATGKQPDEDRAAWDRWRAECITTLLTEIRRAVKDVRSTLPLSVAVGPEAEAAYHHYQDWPSWIERGLVDFLVPMNYTADPARFDARLASWAEQARRLPVVMGWMAGNAEPGLRAAEYAHARERIGPVAVFAYCSLWDSPNTILEKQDEQARAERAERRARLLPLLRGR